MNRYYLVFDTETGGIGLDKSLLTAWFGVYNQDFIFYDSLSLALKPDDGIYKVTGEAMGVNKIDLVEHEKRAIPYKQVKTELYQFLQRWATDAGNVLIPVGHVVSGDIDHVIDKLISRGSWEQFVSYKPLDTCIIARALQEVGKLPSDLGLSLRNLVSYFDIRVNGNPHEAEYDARATAILLQHLLGVMK